YGLPAPGTSSPAIAFTGHERDNLGTTGPADDLDYMHARYYSPQMGRFLQVDSAKESANPATPQSWNRYAYTLNNPMRYVDPDGRMSSSAMALEHDIKALLEGTMAQDEYLERIAARGEAALTAISVLEGAALVHGAVRLTLQFMAKKASAAAARTALGHSSSRPRRIVIGRLDALGGLQQGETTLLNRLPDQG